MMRLLFGILAFLLSFSVKAYAAAAFGEAVTIATPSNAMSAKPAVGKATPGNATPGEPASGNATQGIATSYKYKMVEEAAYTEQLWSEFYSSYPEYADPSGGMLRAGLSKDFLPYYSMTMDDYEEGNVFGGWEITEYDATGENIVSHGVYAYGRIKGEERDSWHELSKPYISTWLPYFRQHYLTAEVVGGNTVKISINVDVEDQTGGFTGRCGYQLSPDKKLNFVDKLSNPWINVIDYPRARRGRLEVLDFSSKSTEFESGRVLIFKGNWYLSGADLTELKRYGGGDTLYWSGGLESSGGSDCTWGTVTCHNLANSLNKAMCGHTSRRYEQISGDESNHRVYCTSCGLDLGNEAHGARDEFERCTKCMYQFNVSGNIISKFNGYTRSKPYSMKPGSEYIPVDVLGYKTPPKAVIPQKGGDINIEYQPISYSLVSEGLNKQLLYDSTYIVEPVRKKGMKNIGFIVK